MSILAVVVVAWSLFHYKTNTHSYEECTNGANIAALNDLEINTAIDPDNKTEKTNQNQQKISNQIDCSDLSAQWAMSDIAMLGYIAGLLGLVFLGVTVYETKSAADSTKAALDLAKENSKKELRAYLSTIVLAKNIHESERRTPTLVIKFINKGTTPAINPQCHVSGMGADEYIDCNATIHPGDAYEIEWPLEGLKRQDDHTEEIQISFTYSDIFNGTRWAKTEFIVSYGSFPVTLPIVEQSMSTAPYRPDSGGIANPSHISERRIQLRTYRDDLQEEAKKYKEAKKA